jgi:hypothetical protein
VLATIKKDDLSQKFKGDLYLWQDKDDASHAFYRNPEERSVWYETVNEKIVYKFELQSETENEVLLYDGTRNYQAYVKLDGQSCLFSFEKDNGFFLIYSGSWKKEFKTTPEASFK